MSLYVVIANFHNLFRFREGKFLLSGILTDIGELLNLLA